MEILNNIYRDIKTVFFVIIIIVYIVISSLLKEYGFIMSIIFLLLVFATLKNLIKKQWAMVLIYICAIFFWREIYQPHYVSYSDIDSVAVLYKGGDDVTLYNPRFYYSKSNLLLIIMGIGRWKELKEIESIKFNDIKYIGRKESWAILKLKEGEFKKTQLDIFSKRCKIIAQNEDDKTVTVSGLDIEIIAYIQ